MVTKNKPEVRKTLLYHISGWMILFIFLCIGIGASDFIYKEKIVMLRAPDSMKKVTVAEASILLAGYAEVLQNRTFLGRDLRPQKKHSIIDHGQNCVWVYIENKWMLYEYKRVQDYHYWLPGNLIPVPGN